jgi:hypothetical protein
LYAEGAIQADGAFTSNGVANFNGTLQVNGVVGYVLTEVFEENISPWTATVAGLYNAVFTSTAFTKPLNEIWVFELSYNVWGNVGYTMGVGARYGSQTVYTGTYKFNEVYQISTNSIPLINQQHRWVEGTGVALTTETVKIDTYAGNNSAMRMFLTTNAGLSFLTFPPNTTLIAPSTFRIYKYKTA